MTRFDVMTLFPEMIDVVLSQSIIGRARNRQNIQVECHQIRDYSNDKHNRVDDAPYGGGNGMVMMAEPIAKCFEHVCSEVGSKPFLIYMSPAGRTLNQQLAIDISKYSNIAILCGHYEGVDERVIDRFVDERISIGDYVLTGGELPALVLIDTISRMIPGVLSNEDCFKKESYYSGLLEHPQYTRPYEWRGVSIPEVLVSGNHKNIEKWRNENSLLQTKKFRPDLLENKKYEFCTKNEQ